MYDPRLVFTGITIFKVNPKTGSDPAGGKGRPRGREERSKEGQPEGGGVDVGWRGWRGRGWRRRRQGEGSGDRERGGTRRIGGKGGRERPGGRGGKRRLGVSEWKGSG